jgi:tetratricopeptide (TPR) repeat protein
VTDRPGDAAELARLQQHLMTNANDRVGWHNLGVEWRRFGKAEAALNAFDEALKRGAPAPETLAMRGHVLADLGRFDDAVAQYRVAAQANPALVEVHETLARLLPQLGRSETALDSYRAALGASPQTGALWVSAMGAAQSLGEHGQLLEWARAAENRFGSDTMITVFAATALSALGRDGEAMDEAQRAASAEPDYAQAQTLLAHVALKARDLRRAEAAALASVKLNPFDQSPWALLTIIWRLMGDPREEWLADYDKLVMPAKLEGIDLAATRDALTALHVTRAHPADQSLRGGTQTRGNLFDRQDPTILALRQAIERAIGAALNGTPHDDHHPFYGRVTGGLRFQGSWSVRLASEGFHISHIHPNGWLSSACYIDLPPEVGGSSDAGALAFGIPDQALKLDLEPRRIVRPEPGMLVLFPSYFWHGTLPFESDRHRLTVAFDAAPVRADGSPA